MVVNITSIFEALIIGFLLWAANEIYKKLKPFRKWVTNIVSVSDRVDKMEEKVVVVEGRQMALMYCDPKPIFLLNEKNEVKFVNPAWLEMTGMENEKSAMGFGYLRAIPEEDRDTMMEHSETFLKHPGSFAGEVTFRHVKTGAEILCYCRSEIVNSKERLVETVGILKPV